MSKPLYKHVVQGALDIISDPERWTTGTFARDAYNFSVSCRADAAVRFCMLGAMARTAAQLGIELGIDDRGDDFVDKLATDIADKVDVPCGSLVHVNDDLGREAACNVLKAYLKEAS